MPGRVKPEGKTSLVKYNIARNDDAPGLEIETAVPLVRGGITEKGTSCRARSELVASRGGQIAVAETPKDMKMGVIRCLVVE
jgi:hypothetical protein